MISPRHSDRHLHAAALLEQVIGPRPGIDVVESLSSGLNTVRDLMFRRIHQDVEAYFGLDSMSVPVSPQQSEYNAKAEIDVWQIVEASDFMVQAGYLQQAEWALSWLGELRLGGSFINQTIGQRVTEYLQQDEAVRRNHFARSLENVYSEARRCPLVLYQLLPHAVRVVVAVAFGSTRDAAEQRHQQTFLLPGISDCRSCRGGVLDNGESCDDCGNPLWTYKWLLTVE